MFRKTALGILLLVVLMGSCSLTESRQISVEGHIHHLGRSLIRISYYTDDHTIAYDSVYSSTSGKFRFTIPGTGEVNPVTLYFPDTKSWTTLFTRRGDAVHILGNIERIDLLSIRGGTVNNDLTRFKQEIGLLYIERQQIIEGELQRGENAVEMRLAEINLILKRKAKDFVLEHPSSIASVVLIQDFFYQDYDPVTVDLIATLEGEAKKCRLTERLRQGVDEW